MPQATSTNNLLFSDFLRNLQEEEPRLPYFASVGQQGRSPNERRVLSNLFGDVYNEYLGALGQEAQQGFIPQASFQEFLAANPLSERYSAMAPSLAGRGTRRFSPTTRWLTSY